MLLPPLPWPGSLGENGTDLLLALPSLGRSRESVGVGRWGDRGTARTEPAVAASSSDSSQFVLRVLFGGTSTHVAIFICERGRIFFERMLISGSFPAGRKRVSHSYSFLPASSTLCINTPMQIHTNIHTVHTHTERQTLGSIATILRLCIYGPS